MPDALGPEPMSEIRWCSLTYCNQRKHGSCAQVQCIPHAEVLHWLQIERAGDTRHSLREEAAAVLAAVLQASNAPPDCSELYACPDGAAASSAGCTIQQVRLIMTALFGRQALCIGQTQFVLEAWVRGLRCPAARDSLTCATSHDSSCMLARAEAGGPGDSAAQKAAQLAALLTSAPRLLMLPCCPFCRWWG